MARNTGVRAAGGELLAFLDADDVWLPGYLESQLRVYRANGGGCLVFCDAWIGNGRMQEGAPPFEESDPVLSLVRGYPIQLSGVVVPREALLRVELFPEGLRWGPDVSLLLKLARSGLHFRRNPEALVVYRSTPGSLSNTRKRESAEHLLQALRGLSRDPELSPSVRAAAATRAAGLYRRFRYLAREMLATGDWEEARRCAFQVLRMRPRDVGAWVEGLLVASAPRAAARLAWLARKGRPRPR